ncbi:uracil phosphoribosyltransferase [Cognatazoarcus halotolerans]|uniref:uracil phosphoribosyltransferase n=1 Tax=Cognatazoarcus halotolerans TaxID=2686016 RepID=UPI00135B3DFA|nr:uracil phosphoribosyltransferase [Cognatazoarcus halotolerans]MCB1902189.1 uracil phosphoribosyltransferase [Rhodocyclaceae bacterium]MCP5308750.1 uracil phosphoribosyltransferase [Zoogloeaceae bacterium]MCP5466071.1 uracil phosphoribosyltransferase [Nevskiaceae bacterium]HQV08667.1 uracil phosphoribosyltransferase [Thauera sp.]
MHPNVQVIDHPLLQHKLTIVRRSDTTTDNFRRLVREIASMMAYEATRDLPVEQVSISTPVADCEAPMISGKKLCLVSILRAGNGMLDGMIDLLPGARVGHVGLYRDPHTLEAIEYYYKVPDDIEERLVIVVDPMLATGNSASAALSRLKEDGVSSLKFVCLLAAPEGLAALAQQHPDVPVTTGAIDSHLNDHGYIVPGLGDAGDRIFGTQ